MEEKKLLGKATQFITKGQNTNESAIYEMHDCSRKHITLSIPVQSILPHDERA